MKTVETFLSVPGYEGLYEVSNLGNVKSLRTGKLMKLSKNNDGYLATSLTKNGKSRGFFAHKLVALAFLPNPENYNEVNHKDEDKSNNCVENLEWCSHKYNLNYGSYRDKMSKTQTGKKRPRKNKIEVQEYDPMKSLREELAKEREKDNTKVPFWKRERKSTNIYEEWSDWLEKAEMEINLM